MAVDADQLRVGGRYESQLPLSELTIDLGELEMACHRFSQYRRQVRWISLAVVISGIVLFFAAAGSGYFRVLGAAVTAGGIGGAIYASRYARQVVERQPRCAVVRRIADIVREDLHPKAPVTVSLNMGEPGVLQKEVPWPKRRKGKERFYSDDWLAVDAHLLDGTDFSTRVRDLVRERSYVNPRGKSKKKTRTRYLVAMRFAYPAEVYGDLRRTGAKPRQEYRLPPGASVKAVEVSDRAVKVKAMVGKPEDLPAACLALALGSYRILNLGRKQKAHPGAGKAGRTN